MSLLPNHGESFEYVDDVNFFLKHLFTNKTLLLETTHRLFDIALCDGQSNDSFFAGILLAILEKLNDSS